MARLSLPITGIRDRYDVVVVGSGYGASIAASRLARAGRSVCVLERGKEFRPGDYPDTGPEAAAETQVDLPSGQHLGSATGLLDFHVNDDLNVLVGCGLGGTSLINANVSLRAEPRVFEDSRWPQQIRDDLAGGIEAGYERAFEMLKPVPYPDDFPVLAKLEAQRKSAEHLGERFYRPPINVTFEDGVNHVGVPQKACRLVGDCVSGCNHSAKNTLIMNYLPDAVNHGAEIFTKTQVWRVEKAGDDWLVHFNLHDSGREYFSAPTMFVRASVVVLGAGALGSTEVLLRSQRGGLDVSDRLGYGFSGNGDVLGFGYNNDLEINGIGLGTIPPEQADPVGPTITGIIDVREQEDLEDGYVIEEGAIPGAIRFFLPTALAAAGLGGRDTDSGDWLEERKREAASLFGGAGRGAVDNTQTYLVMAHDGSAGRLELDGNQRVRVRWPGVGAQPVFRRVNEALEKATEALGGTYVKNPTWSPMLGQDLVTVHPLGGCVMADDAEHGVTNHKGQVFSGKKGTDAYDGLYVMDGSVIPRSVGVNPLLTICAIAERNVALLAKERGWDFDYSFPPVPAVPDAALPTGIQFTESMKGFFGKAAEGNYQAGLEKGRAEGTSFEFVLTVIADDVDRFLDEPEHEAGMVGTVRAPSLSEKPLTVTDGRFNLFVDVDDAPVTKKMIYNMTLTSVEGRRYRFSGYKTIRNDPGLDVWPDTTTLYITVHDGESEDSPVLGTGILKILPADFARQMTTMHANNAPGVVQAFGAVARFGRAFAGDLLEAYGGAEKLFRNASR